MIVLDHNIPFDQNQQLRSWRIQAQHVGFNVGRPEWADQQEVLRHLHSLRQPTFFTRDLGFFKRRLCHRNYCLVVLTGPGKRLATFGDFFDTLPFDRKSTDWAAS